MDYCSEASSDLAKLLERKFQRLPQSAGILFVGVEPIPCPGGDSTTFRVHLGIERRFTVDTGVALVEDVLKAEKKIYNIECTVHRGVSCPLDFASS